MLARAGETRQVVVFTHDERLPEAIRRLAIPARVLRVSRRASSQVQVDVAKDPTEALLDDARQVVKGETVPALMSRLEGRGPLDGTGRFVEVYPAAALHRWGLTWKGYKDQKPENRVRREVLVRSLLDTARTWLRVESGEA